MLDPLDVGYTIIISGLTGTDNKWQLQGDNHWVRTHTRTVDSSAFVTASSVTNTAQELIANYQLNTWEFLGVTPVSAAVPIA